MSPSSEGRDSAVSVGVEDHGVVSFCHHEAVVSQCDEVGAVTDLGAAGSIL